MTRLSRAWAELSRERRIAALAALALLVTMFLPWYGLQSLNRKSGAIYSHNINAFGDVSFVEAAIFIVAAGVVAMLLGRAEGRDFHLPGGDGTIVAIAGGWAGLLIFYRVFDRPAGNGYPVGIQWGFFLAFVAAGSLAYAGWRMRATERPEPPARRRRDPAPPPAAGADPETEPLLSRRRERPAPAAGETAPRREGDRRGAPPRAVPARPRGDAPAQPPAADTQDTVLIPSSPGARRPAPGRPRYPPRPGEPEQLSFEDPPAGAA
jgi:hypothetical protein